MRLRSLICHASSALLGVMSTHAQHPGQPVYESACATCHHSDGSGWHEKNGPTLIGTDWVTGDPSRLVRLTLSGLYKRIPLKNGTHYGLMPGSKDTLDDVQIAAVLSYIRQSWGNAAAPVEIALVAKLRAEADQRTMPWTAQDFGLKAESKLGSTGEALEPPGKFAAAGFKTYLMICVGCHQIHGKGLDTGAGHGFPPLVGSNVVNGPQNTLIRVVLGGLEGKNNPVGGPPNETMPPWGLAMNDEQVAQVLTFVRQAWNHTQSAVSANAVRRLRAETKARNGRMWNPEDLARAATLDAAGQ